MIGGRKVQSDASCISVIYACIYLKKNTYHDDDDDHHHHHYDLAIVLYQQNQIYDGFVIQSLCSAPSFGNHSTTLKQKNTDSGAKCISV